jgi:hypothetical protein
MVCLSGDKVCISLRPRSGVFDSAGSRLARVFASARCCLPCCLTPSAPRNTRFRSSIPSLQIPLSNASSAALRLPSHGSGPGWFAIPSLYDSFIRYSMPVYPGAIQTRGSAPLSHNVRRPPWRSTGRQRREECRIACLAGGWLMHFARRWPLFVGLRSASGPQLWPPAGYRAPAPRFPA